MEDQQSDRQEYKQATRDHPLDRHPFVYGHAVSNIYLNETISSI